MNPIFNVPPDDSTFLDGPVGALHAVRLGPRLGADEARTSVPCAI
jgi:hypothetical protein